MGTRSGRNLRAGGDEPQPFDATGAVPGLKGAPYAGSDNALAGRAAIRVECSRTKKANAVTV